MVNKATRSPQDVLPPVQPPSKPKTSCTASFTPKANALEDDQKQDCQPQDQGAYKDARTEVKNGFHRLSSRGSTAETSTCRTLTL